MNNGDWLHGENTPDPRMPEADQPRDGGAEHGLTPHTPTPQSDRQLWRIRGGRLVSATCYQENDTLTLAPSDQYATTA